MLPLDDIKVLDFSFHLPGPLASLILAEAGANVVKLERPGGGDELRQFPPMRDGESLGFAMLNRGKRSVALDLKSPDAVGRLAPLIRDADVVVEQFRPGVMERLGLGYEHMRAINPNIIYCSITGYGQTGPDRMKAGHDLNYCADTGLLSLSGDVHGAPVVPPTTFADIAGGSYPAVMNILMALRRRDRCGEGAHLDISMSGNLFPMQYWAIAEMEATGRSPRTSGSLLSGGSPRYSLYRAADGRFIAAAPLEQRFWDIFCERLDLAQNLRDDSADPEATRAGVAERIASRPVVEWVSVLGDDCCCTLLASMDEALANPQFRAAGLFAGKARTPAGQDVIATDVPIVTGLRDDAPTRRVPSVGEHNDALLGRGFPG